MKVLRIPCSSLCSIIALLIAKVVTETMTCTKDNAHIVGNVVISVSQDLKKEMKKIFNISGNEGFVEAFSASGDCRRWNVSVILMKETTDLTLYDPQALEAIRQADVILGHENQGIRSFISQTLCPSCFALYFRFTPVGIDLEREIQDRFMRGDRPMSTSYSLWPSPSSFINCVVGNTVLLTKSRKERARPTTVVILSYSESEEALVYITELEKALRQRKMNVHHIDLHILVGLVSTGRMMPAEVDKLFTLMQRIIFTENQADMVIFYMDARLKMQIRTLKVLLSKRAQLDRHEMPWLIADIELMAHQKAREELAKLDLIKIRLYVLRPCLVFETKAVLVTMEECHSATLAPARGVEAEGLAAGRAFLEAILKHRRNNKFSFLNDVIQTNCPNWSYLSNSSQSESRGWLNCVNTVQKVGFPRYDHIVTEILNPGKISEERLIANYFHQDRFNEWYHQMLRINSDFTLGTETVRMENYVVFGHKSPDRVDYVVFVPEVPFVYVESDGSYSGMCVDIYRAVVMKLIERGILLKLRQYHVESHGTRTGNGSWNGACGEITKGDYEYDGSRTVLAIGSFATTQERLDEPKITFSTVIAQMFPTYMTRTRTLKGYYAQFLRPFTSEVWMLLALVFFLSGLYLCIIQAWNPFQEQLPDGSNFNLEESLWHSYLIVTQIGAPYGAVHSPSRVYSVFYWFFALVVVGCYTGNLAGFLAETSSYVPTIADLVQVQGFKYGYVKNGSRSSEYVEEIVGKSNRDLLLDHAKLELVDSYEAGATKVKKEDFILLGNSLALQHYQQTDESCELSVVRRSDSFYNQKIEGMAFPIRSNWEMADEFKWAMRDLKESGELMLIYHKWIKPNEECSEQSNDHKRLDWHDFIGLYILTSSGIFLSYTCVALKLCHLKLKKRKKNRMNNESEADTTGALMSDVYTTRVTTV